MDQQPTQPAPSAQAGEGGSKNTGMAILAYIIFFVPLLTDAKNDPFVKYHVKQGLVLFLAGLLSTFVGIMIPILGWLLMLPLTVALIALFVIGIMNVLNGKQKPLPIIGKFGDEFKF